jgi:hypothetical protein
MAADLNCNYWYAIFIIGHWRTGTTLLHELLTLDEGFTAPSTIECFAPALCLALGWLLRRLKFFLPANRPMDNMLLGWDQPQEDEFALMNLGLGSPYEAMIFPNHREAGHPANELTSPHIRPQARGKHCIGSNEYFDRGQTGHQNHCRSAQPVSQMGLVSRVTPVHTAVRSRCSLPMRNRALKSELATDALPIIRLRCRHHQVLNRETQSRYGNTRLILAAAGGTPAASRRRRQSPSSNAQAIEIGPSCCTNW